MSYFAISTVVSSVPTAATGTVTFAVADASQFRVGDLITIRPQGIGQLGGVSTARLSHRARITAIAGANISAILNQNGTTCPSSGVQATDVIDAMQYAGGVGYSDGGHINPGTLTYPTYWSIIDGSVLSPVTDHLAATVMITRRSAMTVVDDSNAALWVNHVNNGATQPVALKGYAANIGAGDACAVYGQVTTITGRAYGGFFLASVASNASGTPGAIGVNPFIGNATGVDATWDGAGSTPFLAGVFIQAVGSGGKKTGAAIMVSDSNNHEVGIGFKPGSVVDYTFLDSSSSVRSLYVTGAHSYGLDLSTGTYSVASILIDPTFALANVSANEPIIQFDTSDFMAYLRSTNQLQMLVGGAVTLFLGSGLLGFVGLPTSDPGAGSKQFWSNAGTVHWSN